jgi:DNA repair protein RecO (recombination protein O)
MDFTEPAIILKVGAFREIDLWVRLATPGHGVLTAFAFGGSKSRRRFMGCLAPLNLVDFQFHRSGRGEYLYLMEGRLGRGCPGLRADAARLGPAVNCVKFYEAVFEGPDGGEESFALLAEALEIMEDRADLSPLLPLLFRAKVVFLQGYGPGFGACPRCGKDLRTAVAPTLLVEQGVVACAEHAHGSGRRVTLDAWTVDLLETVRMRSVRRWADAVPPDASRRRVFDAVDALVRYHLGLAWEDGRFRRV